MSGHCPDSRSKTPNTVPADKIRDGRDMSPQAQPQESGQVRTRPDGSGQEKLHCPDCSAVSTGCFFVSIGGDMSPQKLNSNTKEIFSRDMSGHGRASQMIFLIAVQTFPDTSRQISAKTSTKYGIFHIIDPVTASSARFEMSTTNQKKIETVEDGVWMYYDAAADATGKSEKTLKRYVKKGELKARRMGNQVNSPVQVWITPSFKEAMGKIADQRVEDPDIFQTEELDYAAEEIEETVDDARTITAGHVPTTKQPQSTDAYESMVKLMVSEFASQLDRKQDLLIELQKELVSKEAQLRLLPDLQRKLEDRERDAHIEKAALEKQIEAVSENFENEKKRADELSAENERLKQEVEAAKSKKSLWSWLTGQ